MDTALLVLGIGIGFILLAVYIPLVLFLVQITMEREDGE